MLRISLSKRTKCRWYPLACQLRLLSRQKMAILNNERWVADRQMKRIERSAPRLEVRLTLRFCVLAFLLILGATSALAQTPALWKPQWDKTVSAAKKEGKVVVFGPAG